MSVYDSSYEDSGFDTGAMYMGTDAGVVQLQFVDPPALNGDAVQWTFRTVGGATAPVGTVTAEIAVMSHDHNLLGGGRNTLRSELGPHDVGASRVRPLQYTPNDGEYYLSINVGGDTRMVSYRIHSGSIQAA